MATSQILPAASPVSTGPRSRSSSPRSKLSLDLSDLPPLIQPAPPSNTLLITNLNDPQIFHPENLHSFRHLLEAQLQTTLHAFSPLKSFRRIIVVFPTSEHAVAIKASLDHSVIHGDIVRCYFGEPTPLMSAAEAEQKRHLQAPRVDKLFFISPPPSPPAGWEVRAEDPPNKDVHAEDLAAALAKLHHAARPASPITPDDDRAGDAEHDAGGMEGIERSVVIPGIRSRSATIVYHPGQHGHAADLPAIAVEDTSDVEEDSSPMEGVERKFARTERPPVELM